MGKNNIHKTFKRASPLKRMDKEIPTKYNPIPPKGTCVVT